MRMLSEDCNITCKRLKEIVLNLQENACLDHNSSVSFPSSQSSSSYECIYLFWVSVCRIVRILLCPLAGISQEPWGVTLDKSWVRAHCPKAQKSSAALIACRLLQCGRKLLFIPGICFFSAYKEGKPHHDWHCSIYHFPCKICPRLCSWLSHR